MGGVFVGQDVCSCGEGGGGGGLALDVVACTVAIVTTIYTVCTTHVTFNCARISHKREAPPHFTN